MGYYFILIKKAIHKIIVLFFTIAKKQRLNKYKQVNDKKSNICKMKYYPNVKKMQVCNLRTNG